MSVHKSQDEKKYWDWMRWSKDSCLVLYMHVCIYIYIIDDIHDSVVIYTVPHSRFVQLHQMVLRGWAESRRMWCLLVVLSVGKGVAHPAWHAFPQQWMVGLWVHILRPYGHPSLLEFYMVILAFSDDPCLIWLLQWRLQNGNTSCSVITS